MPLSDFLLGKDFPKIEPFVEALQQGIDKELTPLKEEIAQLKILLGDASAAAAAAASAAQAAQAAANNAQSAANTAQNTANDAQNTANNAQNTANDAQTAANNPPPPVTVTITPPVTTETPSGEQPPPVTTPAATETIPPVTTQPAIEPTPTPDPRITVTIRWRGSPNGTVNSRRFLRIATNPGDVTLVERAVVASEVLSAQVLPGTSLKLVANPGFGGTTPEWREVGGSTVLDRDVDYRPTAPNTNLDLVAIFPFS